MTKSKKSGAFIASEIENWEIEKLIPYDKNHKVHDEAQINDLVRIIENQGFDQPIVVDETGVILKGHGRRLAALKLNMRFAPVIVRRGLSDVEKNAMRIADNLIARRGQIDQEVLQSEVLALVNEKVDLNLMGFDEDEIVNITKEWLDLNVDLPKTESVQPVHTVESVEKLRANEQEYQPSYQIVVVCEDEVEQRAVYEKLSKAGCTCKVQTI